MVAVIALVAAHQAWSVAQGLAHCHMAFPPQVRGSGIGLESVVKRHAEGGRRSGKGRFTMFGRYSQLSPCPLALEILSCA